MVLFCSQTYKLESKGNKPAYPLLSLVCYKGCGVLHKVDINTEIHQKATNSVTYQLKEKMEHAH